MTEGSDPTGFSFESLTCSASGTGTSVTPNATSTSTKTANITLAGDGAVTCLYVNKGSGALEITKTSSKGGGLQGATFSVTGPNSYSNSVTTDENGKACLDGLAAGSYTVTETAAP